MDQIYRKTAYIYMQLVYFSFSHYHRIKLEMTERGMDGETSGVCSWTGAVMLVVCEVGLWGLPWRWGVLNTWFTGKRQRHFYLLTNHGTCIWMHRKGSHPLVKKRGTKKFAKERLSYMLPFALLFTQSERRCKFSGKLARCN